MRQLLILSGKGGTGKTTIAGAFIRLAQAKAYADCDVDAPNLHLVMNQASAPRRTEFYGMSKAHIDPERCTACGLCSQNCRFGAIKKKGGYYHIDPFACEGCGVCSLVCPSAAVSMQPTARGRIGAVRRRTRRVFHGAAENGQRQLGQACD